MSDQKITIINGELCRVANTKRNEVSDESSLLPYSINTRVAREENNFFNMTCLSVSILFWIALLTWISLGALLLFFKSSIIGYCFHLLTFLISLLMSESTKTLIAYMLLKNNYDESSRLRNYLSLNPGILISAFDPTSFIVMASTFFLLGIPMLNIKQLINYEALTPNWKKSFVAISGPLFHFIFGLILSSIHIIGFFLIDDMFLKGLTQFLILGMRLQAFLTVINIIPLPPVTDGYKAISPYLPEGITRDISNAKNTFIFFVLSTILFIFISQSSLVINTVDFIVKKVYLMDHTI
ncbi:tetratricopeptide repeat-containing protein [Cryptosporidium ubiquitum]|uniref:Tetratricopeptide repeat-containing protein n=1 Tax=Cryptosporidium ubiquitum TaxID=857276 RepID=A0A1J4MGG0_9CRYT|nr:tetratricopeptide repeat-containing protein [Cryptosporidium ubiquitum]OII72108.1 tetratricopeptide repeat-containing protein [Cryptosporidium ubiquitum]